MIRHSKKRPLLVVIAAILLLNIAFLLRIKFVEKFADFSAFRVVFYPSKLTINFFGYIALKLNKIYDLSLAHDQLQLERSKRLVLEAENSLLKQKIASLERLESLEKVKKEYPFQIEITKIIGRNPLFWHQYIIVEGGEDRNFTVGMPVITKDGLVGKITKVYPEYSKVLLLIDPEFSVDVRGYDSNVLALCSGVGTSVMKISYVPRFEEMSVGEVLVTSGLDKSFPEGIPVGYLIEVNKPFGAYFLDAYVIPVVDVLKITEVMVVKDFGKKK